MKIKQTIPNVGLVEVDLYPPADELYAYMLSQGEVARLQALTHIGLLKTVFPGVPHSRWDYTVSMLYVIAHDCSPGMTTSIRHGGVAFSSVNAAAQCAALLSNIGHLPGTFAVEKGVARYLWEQNPEDPLGLFPWEQLTGVLGDRVTEIKGSCTSHFLGLDYLALNRVLAIWKALEWACSAPGSLQDLFTKFWVNFVCRHKRNSWKQWEKIDTCYEFARRLAYLNLDSVYCDLPLASPAASMIRRMVRGNTGGHELGELKNVLAAYERAAFNALYHSPPARRAVAFVADRVHLKLRRLEVAEASSLILHWLKVNPPDLCDPDIVVGDEEPRFSVAAKYRSFFIPNPPSIVGWEQELARKVRPAAAVSILLFPAWDIGMVHLEPDEVLVDVFGSITPDTRLIGRLISWLADRLDRPNASPKDPYWMAVRGDLVEVYRDLLNQAVTALFLCQPANDTLAGMCSPLRWRCSRIADGSFRCLAMRSRYSFTRASPRPRTAAMSLGGSP